MEGSIDCDTQQPSIRVSLTGRRKRLNVNINGDDQGKGAPHTMFLVRFAQRKRIRAYTVLSYRREKPLGQNRLVGRRR
jgi:hypothetical protein